MGPLSVAAPFPYRALSSSFYYPPSLPLHKVVSVTLPCSVSVALARRQTHHIPAAIAEGPLVVAILIVAHNDEHTKAEKRSIPQELSQVDLPWRDRIRAAPGGRSHKSCPRWTYLGEIA